jgi:hypothetical protein
MIQYLRYLKRHTPTGSREPTVQALKDAVVIPSDSPKKRRKLQKVRLYTSEELSSKSADELIQLLESMGQSSSSSSSSSSSMGVLDEIDVEDMEWDTIALDHDEDDELQMHDVDGEDDELVMVDCSGDNTICIIDLEDPPPET